MHMMTGMTGRRLSWLRIRRIRQDAAGCSRQVKEEQREQDPQKDSAVSGSRAL